MTQRLPIRIGPETLLPLWSRAGSSCGCGYDEVTPTRRGGESAIPGDDYDGARRDRDRRCEVYGVIAAQRISLGDVAGSSNEFLADLDVVDFVHQILVRNNGLAEPG